MWKPLSLWHVFLSRPPSASDTLSSMHFESGICRTSSLLFTALNRAYHSEQGPITSGAFPLPESEKAPNRRKQHLEGCAHGSSFMGWLMSSLNDGLKHMNCFLLLQKHYSRNWNTRTDLWTAVPTLPNTFGPNTYSSSHTQVWRVISFKNENKRKVAIFFPLQGSACPENEAF